MLNGTEPFDGKVEDGYNVVKSFYAQHQLESLTLDNNLITELAIAAPAEKEGNLRGLLGAFLFAGDDIMKKIKVLSGGEKARVALAKMILSKANFLILDEPTNHLDMTSVNILIRVLQDFEGTFIVVSHDRFFVAAIANKIWWIENHHIKEYPGDYEEYEYARQQALKQQKAAAQKPVKQAEKKPEKEVEKNEEEKKAKAKLTKKFQQLESKIASLNEKKSALERELAKPEIYENPKVFAEKLAEFNAIEKELKEVTAEWEKVFEELEK
jgi:ATP-binding cassette, subfamily F, member 3